MLLELRHAQRLETTIFALVTQAVIASAVINQWPRAITRSGSGQRRWTLQFAQTRRHALDERWQQPFLIVLPNTVATPIAGARAVLREL